MPNFPSLFLAAFLLRIHVPLAVISLHHALQLGWLLNFPHCCPSQEGNHVVPTMPQNASKGRASWSCPSLATPPR